MPFDHNLIPKLVNQDTVAGVEIIIKELKNKKPVVVDFGATLGTWFKADGKLRFDIGTARNEPPDNNAVVSIISTDTSTTLELINLNKIHPIIRDKLRELIAKTKDLTFLRCPPSVSGKKLKPVFATSNYIQIWTLRKSPLTQKLIDEKLNITAVRSGNIHNHPEATTLGEAGNYALAIGAPVIAYSSAVDESKRVKKGSQPILNIPAYEYNDEGIGPATIEQVREGNFGHKTMQRFIHGIIPGCNVILIEEKPVDYRHAYDSPDNITGSDEIRNDQLKAAGLL